MKKGFTLIEIMVSLSIFMIVMTVSMGAIYTVLDANKKAEADKSAMDNLDLAIETMSREMRFGRNYHCGSDVPLSAPQNCGDPGADEMAFLSADGDEVVYRQQGTTIERSTDGGSSFESVTAPEVVIESLTFYVLGAGTGDNLQPKTLIKIKGYSQSGAKADTRSEFTLETLVSERTLDNGL